MQGKFQMFPKSQAARNQPTPLLKPMQQLFGDDPDPLFLEESWTFGVPAAIEKRNRRRQQQAERERQGNAHRDLDRMAAVNFAPASAALQPSWTPSDWAPEDQIAQRTPPHGWMPATVTSASAYGDEPAALPQAAALSMTIARAQHILGIAPAATREEVRSAYRRRVSQCHPDRYPDATDAVRQRATQQMADLNEAYRLLRSTLLEDAA